MKNPCERDCPDRCATCHGTCEKYKKWKKDYDKEAERIAENVKRYIFQTEPYTMGTTRVKRRRRS